MEPRFGFDFSRVRIHADIPSAQSAGSINARAYTHGTDVVFADGRYAPDTTDGRRLIAHELAHVVQQANSGSALDNVVQRDDGGMSSSQATSSSGSSPNATVASPAQTAGRKSIQEALDDFSQSKFRDVTDWSLASDADKIKLIDKATALDLFWVGPNDEAALERCWSSFGAGFQTAVEANAHLRARSVSKGVEAENVAPTKGKYGVFKNDVLSVARQNLEKNEDRVVAEMAEFGLQPPFELLRPGHPAKRSARPSCGSRSWRSFSCRQTQGPEPAGETVYWLTSEA